MAETVIGYNVPGIEEHLDHVSALEVAWYGEPPGDVRSVTVECAVCGAVVHELYNSDFETEDEDGGHHQSKEGGTSSR